MLFEEDVVVVDHLAGFEIAFGGAVVDDPVHDEIDVLGFVAVFGDYVTLDETLGF